MLTVSSPWIDPPDRPYINPGPPSLLLPRSFPSPLLCFVPFSSIDDFDDAHFRVYYVNPYVLAFLSSLFVSLRLVSLLRYRPPKSPPPRTHTLPWTRLALLSFVDTLHSLSFPSFAFASPSLSLASFSLFAPFFMTVSRLPLRPVSELVRPRRRQLFYPYRVPDTLNRRTSPVFIRPRSARNHVRTSRTAV